MREEDRRGREGRRYAGENVRRSKGRAASPPLVRPFAPSAVCRARGVALVWTAVVLSVLILFVGLSVDWGKATYNVHQLQNAADAAALAGAQWVKVNRTTARDRAQTLALANPTEQIPVRIDRNEANVQTGDLVLGRWDRLARTFTTTLSNPNAVKVVARRVQGAPDGPLTTILGCLANLRTIDITREAIAHSSGAVGGGIICLDHTAADALRLSGGVVLDIDHGDIQVNSNSKQAVTVDGGSGLLDCDWLKVYGDIAKSSHYFDNPDQLDFYLAEGHGRGDNDVTQVVDPLNDPQGTVLPPPDYRGWPDLSPSPGHAYKGPRADGLPFQPGYYSGGFRFTTNSQTVQFAAGIYVVNGSGLYLSGGSLTANGAMFYLAGGSVNLGGGGAIVLTPPASGDYQGITIFQARDNTSQAVISGNNQFQIEGILYFSGNAVDVGGDPGTVVKPADQLICATARFHGNCTVDINYDGQNVIKGFRSVLVK
jgi:Flp pilus assembly protein TadG